MPNISFKSGQPIMADYTPTGGNVSAGDGVGFSNLTAVAHLDIANGTLGSVAVGGGIYSATGLTTINLGDKVYWSTSLNKMVTTAAGNLPFGKCVANVTGANGTGDFLHAPYF